MSSDVQKAFSLRGHSASVACVCAWGGRVVSADRLGEVIVWDLATRRATARWRAHEGHILSMCATALGLMTHGRDSAVRIWAEPKPSPTCVFEMPVNSLNFCNVAVTHFDDAVVMATPASVDSDAVDIYHLSPLLALTRVAQNVVAPTEISTAGARGHGIVMRMAWAARTLFVGYESGAVAAIATSARGAEVVWLAPAHTPHPVLSLEVETDHGCHRVWSGSASKKLMVHEFRGGMGIAASGNAAVEMESVSTHNLRHYGVQCLEVQRDLVVAGFWDGVVAGYGRDWRRRFRLERAHEHIEAPAAALRKSVCVLVWAPPAGETLTRRARLRLRRASGPMLFVGHADGLVTAYDLVAC